MMMNPRTKLDIIVFRRFVIKNNSLEEQARLGTIPQDDVPFIEPYQEAWLTPFLLEEFDLQKQLL